MFYWICFALMPIKPIRVEQAREWMWGLGGWGWIRGLPTIARPCLWFINYLFFTMVYWTHPGGQRLGPGLWFIQADQMKLILFTCFFSKSRVTQPGPGQKTFAWPWLKRWTLGELTVRLLVTCSLLITWQGAKNVVEKSNSYLRCHGLILRIKIKNYF